MIRDLTQWDRRKVVLFIIIAVVASGYGRITFGVETNVHQGLPFSFYRYSEPTSNQDAEGHLTFFAPAFILDMLVWYMIAHLAIRLYDNSKLRQMRFSGGSEMNVELSVYMMTGVFEIMNGSDGPLPVGARAISFFMIDFELNLTNHILV